jgi:uncharacterized integral membrane protein
MPSIDKIPMRGTLIMALAIALIAVIFALQNSGGVNVHLGPFSFAAPLALVLLLTLAAGVLAGYLSTLSKMIRLGGEIRKLKSELTDLQTDPEPPAEMQSDSESTSDESETTALEPPGPEVSRE